MAQIRSPVRVRTCVEIGGLPRADELRHDRILRRRAGSRRRPVPGSRRPSALQAGARPFEGAADRFDGRVQHAGHLARVESQDVAQDEDGELARRQDLQCGHEGQGDGFGLLVAGQIGDKDREAWAKVELDEALGTEALLLGRRSYEFFAARWPSRSGEWADRLNGLPKYVVSSTLEDLDWNNSTVLNGDVANEVSKLKQEVSGDIVVYASFQLVHTLMKHDLVDELRRRRITCTIPKRQPDRTSHCVTIPLTRPDAQGAVHGGHPDFPVAHRFCLGMLGDGFDQGFRIVIKDDDLEPNLR